MLTGPQYAELHAVSNYTFLRGASHPGELVARADELGYKAIAITDECSLSGVVRAHVEAKGRSISLIIGSEFILDDSLHFVLLATDRESYGGLCRLITQGRRQAEKGEYYLTRKDLEQITPQGCLALWRISPVSTAQDGVWLSNLFPGNTWIAITLEVNGSDQAKLDLSQTLAKACELPRVACGNVHMHHPHRRSLRDTLTAIRLGKPLSELGFTLKSNGEDYLRSRRKLGELYPSDLLAESIEIASRCQFCLSELKYEYPDKLAPPGYTNSAWLRHLTEQGMQHRWPEGAPEKVRAQVEKELALIRELQYEPYFLTVYDTVKYARQQNILCQGRGSAANSSVCYCLGITEVDPASIDLLFERFISRERDEPPDIDVDFEHERREEVIQYLYRKYGRDRAALAATVITYQPRSAIRDVGKAIGMSLNQVDLLAKSINFWDDRDQLNQRLEEAGFDSSNYKIMQLLNLVQQILHFPRHLSQHVGGFIMTRGFLNELVPVENAAMADRTVIQWEKDDLESLGLLKVDVLGLGMLSAIHKCFDYIYDYSGKHWTMASVPKEDAAVYGMIQKADTIGVFQIESRAQMSMLPRLKPENYYDLVIEIAIVRPGPIQGDMVHPYLLRRNDPSLVEYESPELEKVLSRTLGVPIFQEQVMQIAIVAAGFTPGEADELRRAMAAWKRRGGLEKFEKKLLDGMTRNKYSLEFAHRIFNQIKGFGDYGFPESHSASFALLAYVSSWLKFYQPAAFCCALINSQPMGFYRPAQLVNDARRHGVEVRPIDIHESQWDCHLQPARGKQPALRLGLRMVKGLSETAAERITRQRSSTRFTSVQDLAQRAELSQHEIEALAASNALATISGHRHRAFWQAAGVEQPSGVFPDPHFTEGEPILRKPGDFEETIADYVSTGLTLGHHPLALIRNKLDLRGVQPAQKLATIPNGTRVEVAGLVINRQRPMTATGVVFVTLEDETGYINLVVWPQIVKSQRKALTKSRLMVVTGHVQIESDVIHVIVQRLNDYSDWIGALPAKSRDFH